MVENLEEGDSYQLAPLTSPEAVQNSVDPKPTEGTNEDDNSNLEKTSSVNFDALIRKDLPANLISTANKSNLQEISLEQKASVVIDSVTVSSEVDHGGFPVVKDTYVFPSESNEINESREAMNDLNAMPSEENIHAPSQTSVMLAHEVQIMPLLKVHNNVSFPLPEKIACEMQSTILTKVQPAILTKVKEDKPHVLHRLHERQMSLGHKRQKEPPPMSRASSGKYRGTDNTYVDTTKPIESVKMAASRFGGSINWRTRRTQPVQDNEHAVLEVDRLKNEISDCKQQAEATETAKLSVFNEIERTKKLIEEMKRSLERAQTEDAHAKEDLEHFQFILQDVDEGAASDDSVSGETLKNIQERQEAVLSKLKIVTNELKNVQKDYNSLLIERDTSIEKSQSALTVCKDTGRQQEELTVELNKLKEVLHLARLTCHDAEEQKICTSLAREEERLTWEKDLRQAEEELSELEMKISSVKDLKSKLEISSNLLLKCDSELTTCMEAKLIDESRQEEINLSRNELEEHMESTEKLKVEVCALKVAAASLQSELSKDKIALATIQSLEVDVELAQRELEAVQSKEKECHDRMAELPKILEVAAEEAKEAKFLATKAQEQLRKNKEEVEESKVGLRSMELRLQAVLKEIESMKESERLCHDALKAPEESKVSPNIENQCSLKTITLDSDEHASLLRKFQQAEELAHDKTSSATAKVNAAKESESIILSTLDQVYTVLEERKNSLHAAKERADMAIKGKLAMEQELRQWREENIQRRKAIEAMKSEAGPTKNVVVPTITVVDRSTKGGTAGKEDSHACVHPLSDLSAGSTPAYEDSATKTKKAKMPPFLKRMFLFLSRKRIK